MQIGARSEIRINRNGIDILAVSGLIVGQVIVTCCTPCGQIVAITKVIIIIKIVYSRSCINLGSIAPSTVYKIVINHINITSCINIKPNGTRITRGHINTVMIKILIIAAIQVNAIISSCRYKIIGNQARICFHAIPARAVMQVKRIRTSLNPVSQNLQFIVTVIEIHSIRRGAGYVILYYLW